MIKDFDYDIQGVKTERKSLRRKFSRNIVDFLFGFIDLVLMSKKNLKFCLLDPDPHPSGDFPKCGFGSTP